MSSANDLAALFNSTSFTKGGKTYSAAVSDATVTFTATEEGEADTIPETVDVFTDEHLSKPVTTECTAPTAKFTNGKDAKTAAESFIEQIKKFQSEVDNDWYYLLTDKDEDEYVIALAKFAEASERGRPPQVLHGPDQQQGVRVQHRPRRCHLRRCRQSE